MCISSVHLDHFANLLAFVMSSDSLSCTIVYTSVSALRREGRRVLPPRVRRSIQTPLVVLVLVRSYKGIELHFDSYNPVMATKKS